MNTVLQLYIEGTRVDLFEDESVNIVQSIQDVKDISRIFVDFSRTFNIPASKTNNKIFQHYYNYSISNGFDARLKKNATIELNNRPFKTGKIKLNGVDLQDGQPNSYRITFFANTIDLKDLLGDDDLSNLDLADFDTPYVGYDTSATPTTQSNNVYKALTDGLSKTYTRADSSTLTYPRGIIAPLISHTTRLYYSGTGETAYPNADGGDLKPKSDLSLDPVHSGVYWQELKYAIKVDAIVKAIEDKYGLTFSTDFFNSTNEAYYGLYMWLHRKKGDVFEQATVSKQVTGFLIDYGVEIPEVRSFGDRFEISGITSGYLEYSLDINVDTSINGRIIIYKNGQEYDTKSITGTYRNLSGTLSNGTYTVFIESEETTFDLNTSTSLSLQATYSQFGGEYALQSAFTFDNVRQFIISQQIPEMKVIDFLTGLFKMFNLTAYSSNGTIIINTLDEFYSGSDTVWDITNYVDTTQHTVDVALPYKEVEFKYEGLGTKLAKQHEQLSNLSWGTEEYRGDDYYDANPETYVVNLPFEHMKYERLYDGSTATTAQVGWFVDDNNSSYFGKPLLFYAKRQTSANQIRFLITENGASPDVSETNYYDTTTYFIPSNSFEIDPTETEININFRNEINEYTATNEFQDTLFKVYYENYISQVFQNNKRLTTIYAYLPIKMLQEFILSDKVAILDRNYTINQIETDFTSGRSKLELINEITLSIGGSTPITTTTTVDPGEECTECSADSTLCTVDSLTPTADKTCDVGRSLTITGLTTAEQNETVTLTATANNFRGTATYLWSGGDAAGETTASVDVTNSGTGNVTYTCVATDDDDSAEFDDTHTILWTPKLYTIELNIVNNIQGPPEGYFISGDQDGKQLFLQQGDTYSFQTFVTPNSGYEFVSGPTIVNAQGTVGTTNLVVDTTLNGSVQFTNKTIEIFGTTIGSLNTDYRLSTTATGFTPTSYQWARSTDGGSTYSDESGETLSYYDANESSEGSYWYRVTASDGTTTVQDVHEIEFVDETLITLTLNVDTSNITASGYSPASLGFTLTGNQTGDTKTQNAGTVFNFSTQIQLNSGYEWVGNPPTVNNAGGTYTTSQTVTTDFSAATIQLIVYNYYIVTGCPDTTVAGQTRYIRSRDTYTVGTTSTGSYIELDGQCYYASSTAFETDWATNNGVTVGAPGGIGCITCTQTEPLVDTCLETKSVAYLRYSTSNDVCENHQSKNFYYIDPQGNDPVTQADFCAATELWNYVGPTTTGTCTVSYAAAGYYSLDSDNTKRRYWNGSSFSVCINCLDANFLYYLGEGFNPLTNYCDEGGVGGYYYFDNNRTLTTATSADHMYTSAANVGTPNRAPQGFYTDLTNYRYYEPSSLQVWESVSSCPVRPDPGCSAPSKPTLTIWRRYGDCATGGLDATVVFGNNTDSFPAVVEYNGDCYSDPVSVSGSQSDPWIDAQTCDAQDNLQYDYPRFSTCLECTGEFYYQLQKCADPNQGKVYRSGQNTTEITLYTNNRVTDLTSATYIVVGQTNDTGFPSVGTVTNTGENGCPIVTPDDNVFVVERQSDGFTTYVQLDGNYQVGDTGVTISTDGANCYDITGEDYVADPTSYGEITGSCTTTTTTTTTTTVVCGSQNLYRSITSASDACCDTTRTILTYMNSNDISTATVIYDDVNCTTIRSTASWYTSNFGEYYYWNGTTLTGPTSCPGCA